MFLVDVVEVGGLEVEEGDLELEGGLVAADDEVVVGVLGEFFGEGFVLGDAEIDSHLKWLFIINYKIQIVY